MMYVINCSKKKEKIKLQNTKWNYIPRNFRSKVLSKRRKSYEAPLEEKNLQNNLSSCILYSDIIVYSIFGQYLSSHLVDKLAFNNSLSIILYFYGWDIQDELAKNNRGGGGGKQDNLSTPFSKPRRKSQDLVESYRCPHCIKTFPQKKH